MSVKRLVPLHAIALADNPQNSRIGDIYYNTDAEELRFFDGSAWNPVGSGTITGLLDHIHTYDGAIFSVENIEVPASDIIDGGTP
jgi:hypothetical protein